jgi:hypothetical protein
MTAACRQNLRGLAAYWSSCFGWICCCCCAGWRACCEGCGGGWCPCSRWVMRCSSPAARSRYSAARLTRVSLARATAFCAKRRQRSASARRRSISFIRSCVPPPGKSPRREKPGEREKVPARATHIAPPGQFSIRERIPARPSPRWRADPTAAVATGRRRRRRTRAACAPSSARAGERAPSRASRDCRAASCRGRRGSAPAGRRR